MDEKKITFEECVLKSAPTGSRYICRPAPTDTDNDSIFLVNGYYDWQTALIQDNWVPCEGEEAYQFAGRFHAFRKGIENYIVTEDEDFFLRYVFATEGAKALNLLKKEDRIDLFQAIADSGEGYVGMPPKMIDDGLGGMAAVVEPDQFFFDIPQVERRAFPF